MPNRASTISPLRGLFEAANLVRTENDLPQALDRIATVVAEALGFQTVIINVYRPEWDDFVAASFNWPYCKKVGEALNRAADAYHARTGAYVRDLKTLGEELRREGVDLGTLRDPLGQVYSFEFDAAGTNYRITVRSSGQNKSFEPNNADSDDFTLWTTLTDYFTVRDAAGVTRSGSFQLTISGCSP